jgi:integrase/recombinase XerD
MSGGPYGRGKAPERACVPPVRWPEPDKLLWQAACAPADLLDEDVGARSRHAAISNLKVERGYGRWLTYLSISAPECLADPPAARITPERVKAYVEHLRSLENGTATILARLQELDSAAKVMGPNQSWRFINRIASRIRASHKPVRDKRNLKLTDELVDLGVAVMKKAESEKGCSAAISFRDGLLIAFLALIPLRRRNLVSVSLGQNLIEINGHWIVALDAAETKTHAPLEMDLPDILVEPLRTYLQKYRPVLVTGKGRWSKPVGDALWASKDGSPMTQIAIYDRIRVRTKEAFGTPINPHLFRDAAATTLAIADPQHVRVAAPLLGHRNFATTERHYLQAMRLEAQRAYVQAVFGKRSQS